MIEFIIIVTIILNIFFLTVLSKNNSQFGIQHIKVIITLSTIMIICSSMAKNATTPEEFQQLLIIYHFFETYIPFFSILAFYEFVNMKQFPYQWRIALFALLLPIAISCIYPPFNQYIFTFNGGWSNYNNLSSYNYNLLYYCYLLVNIGIIIYCFQQFYKAEQKACVLNKSKSFVFLMLKLTASTYNILVIIGVISTTYNFTPMMNSLAFYFTYFIFNSYTFNKYNDDVVEHFVNDINNIILIVDKNKVVVFINKLFANIFKVDPLKICGKKIQDKRLSLPPELLDFFFNKPDDFIASIGDKKFKKSTTTMFYSKKQPLTIYQLIDITEVVSYNNKFLIISTTDPVTGLKNRSAFNSYLEEPIGESKNLWNLIFDIDNLKIYNDIYGNEIGDLIISDFSIFLKETFKNNDDEIFRIAGDEFCIVSHSESQEIIENTLKELFIKAKKFNKLNQYPIMFSVGCCNYSDYTTNKQDIYKFADTAMLKSKLSGKNTYTFFDQTMYKDYINDIKLKDDFIRGVNNDEIEPFFQGQYNVKTGKVDSCEALVRWNHKEHGILSPYKFLHLASSLRIISEIDFIVLEKSCKAHAHWANTYNKKINISINLSLESLIRPTLVHDIIRITKKHDVAPSWITLEILENKIINDFGSIRKIISELMDCGFNFAIDDFGSGFSNFDTIDQLEVDTIKLDKSLIDHIETNANAAKNIGTICKIIKSYNREILAEGVETKRQFEILKKYNVDYIQGYYFSKPVSLKEFEDKFFNNNFKLFG